MIRKSHDTKNPEGAVLIFALMVMMLMGLMATAIFLNTQSEMNISRNTDQGRDAFTKADSAARLALLVARSTRLRTNMGSVDDLLTDGKGTFSVDIGRNFTMASMMALAGDGTETDIRDRYLAAAAVNAPHVVIRHNGQIVATAVVALSYNGAMPEPGASAGQGAYKPNATSTPTEAILTVTATGRVPSSGADGDSDYYSGDADSPHSVVTTIFKDILPN